LCLYIRPWTVALYDWYIGILLLEVYFYIHDQNMLIFNKSTCRWISDNRINVFCYFKWINLLYSIFGFLEWSVLLFFLFLFVLYYYVLLRSELLVEISVKIFALNLCSVRTLPQFSCFVYIICVFSLYWCQTHVVL
jgi:hypothetical protein